MSQSRQPDPPFNKTEDSLALVRLADADARALDARLAARAGDVTGPPLAHVDSRRVERVDALLQLIATWPVNGDDAGEALVQATLDRARAARQRERFATQAQMLAEAGPAGGPAWRQVASAAFAAIIALALLLPALEHNRFEARRTQCAANLSNAGEAMAAYAGDHNGNMPRDRVEPGAPWFHVGQAPGPDGTVTSNSAHLFLLVRKGYVEPDKLACPENRHAALRVDPAAHDWPNADAVSFSYHNQYTDQPHRLEEKAPLAVLADRNPLFTIRVGELRFDADAPRVTPSRAHAKRGQNVLRGDGSVHWQVRPLMRIPGTNSATNIWVADGVTEFTGHETPTGPADSFLVP